MTMPCERTRAVQYAREFLMELLDPKKTPRVPREIREHARRVLRHYPFDMNLEQAAKGAPDDFGKPEKTYQQVQREREYDLIRERIKANIEKSKKKVTKKGKKPAKRV